MQALKNKNTNYLAFLCVFLFYSGELVKTYISTYTGIEKKVIFVAMAQLKRLSTLLNGSLSENCLHVSKMRVLDGVKFDCKRQSIFALSSGK